MGDLFARAGVLFGGLGVLLLILLGGGNSTLEKNPIRIVTPMVESLEDGQCPNSFCIAGLQLTDPVTGAVDTFRVGYVFPEAFYYSPDYTKIGFTNYLGWHVLDLETHRRWLIADDIVTSGEIVVFQAASLLAWSPASTQIAYNSQDGISIVDIETGERHLVSHLYAQYSLHWSPDGTRLLFTANPGNSFRRLFLYTLDLTTGELKNLTQNRPYVVDAIWSPDGSQIVFIMRGSGSNSDLYIINADGTNLERLSTDRHRKWRPRWILDNTALSYSAFGYFQYDLETHEIIRHDLSYKTLGLDVSPDGSQFVLIESIDVLADDYLMTIYDFRTHERSELRFKTYRNVHPEWRS